MDPKVITSSERRTLELYDVRFHYGVEGGDSGGRIAMIEVVIPPRTLVKPHQHSKEDEFTLVLEGTIGARLGEQTREEIPAGSFLVKPRDVPHALWNASEERARIVEVVTPAGLERYFEEVAPVLQQSGPDATARFYELAETYGVSIEDDWVDDLERRHGVMLNPPAATE